MSKKHEIDMCNGPIFGKLLKLSIPMILSSVLQLLFSAADIIVVGNFGSENSVAAVGSTTSLVMLITNLFIGLSVSANVLTSKYIGAKDNKKVSLTIHTSIFLSIICGIILNDIRRYAVIAESEKETIANKLLSLKSKRTMAETKVIKSQITNAENRLAVIKTTIKNLYIDKCSGNIPEEVFKSMMEDFLKEQSDLETQIPQLHDELEQISTATDEVNEWFNLISDFTNIKILNRNVVCELIESIIVSDRQKVDGKWEQSIDIRYRFIGDLLQDEETGVKKENIA